MMHLTLVCVVVAVLVLAGCNPSSEEQAAKWAARWTKSVRSGEHPNSFHPPAPPDVKLPSLAERAKQSAIDASDSLVGFLNEDGEHVKDVLCTWFDWYVDTGTPVPSESDFGPLLLRYGFDKSGWQGADRKVHDAVDRFRNAIDNAQSASEADANLAMAGVCSV